MAQLSKANIAKARRMKGTTNKNLFKRAWKIQKSGGRRKSPATRKAAPRKARRTARAAPRKTGGRKMAKSMNFSVTNLAGAAIVLGHILDPAAVGGKGGKALSAFQQGEIGDGLHRSFQNLTNVDNMKSLATKGGAVVVVKAFSKGLGVRKIGGIGPVNFNI